MQQVFRWTGGAVAIALAVVAAALFSSGGSHAQGATVNVSLTEWAVTPDVASVVEGDVTFNVSNDGAVPHELVIIRTDLAADALPVTGDRVPESEVDVIDEVEEFGAGLTASGTFALTAGNYVLICNLPGHYTAGMYVAFTVTAAPEPEPEPEPELASLTVRAGGDFVAWVYADAMASEVFGDLTIAWLWIDGDWVSYAPVLGFEDFTVTFASVLFLVGDGEVTLEVPALPAPAAAALGSDAPGTVHAVQPRRLETVIEVDMYDFHFANPNGEENPTFRLPAGVTVGIHLHNEGLVVHELAIGRNLVDGEYEELLTELVPSDLFFYDGDVKAEVEGATFGELELDANIRDVWIRITIPEEFKGEWEFGCLLEGHYESGMHATFIVE